MTTPLQNSPADRRNLAILVGGGPAPGINSVIGAATIRASLEGIEVLGIQDGFEWIMRGDIDHVMPLSIDAVGRIHYRGGSHIGISRANPTTDPTHLQQAIASLLRLNVSLLLTIGGDDTAFSAMQLAKKAEGRIRVVHVPKTIDNDLDLPMHVDTFGYQTARHHGCEVVKSLMTDARTTSRWYLVVTMGRKAGHLALGIGKAAGATVTLIPEEFDEPFRLKTIVDTLVGSIIKRLAEGRRFGVAVMAEGLALGLSPEDLSALDTVDRDAHGHIQLDDLNLGDLLKDRIVERLASFGLKAKLSTKKVGFELRCVDPIPVDMEYARDLGYCAAKYLIEGGSDVMVSIQGGQFVPIPFRTLEEGPTGRARVRLVDINSARYAIARRYMIRLRRDDFSDADELSKFAAAANLSVEEFRREFESLVASEPPPFTLERHAESATT